MNVEKGTLAVLLNLHGVVHRQVLQDNYKELSDALTHLIRRGDGTVTVEELLNIFHSCRCFIQREQLINHLHRSTTYFTSSIETHCIYHIKNINDEAYFVK